MSYLKKAEALWDKASPYAIPYLIAPIAVIYGIDYLKFMLSIVQYAIIFAMTALMGGFFSGIYLYVAYYTKEKKPVFIQGRIAVVLPTIRFGYELMVWLMEDLGDDN